MLSPDGEADCSPHQTLHGPHAPSDVPPLMTPGDSTRHVFDVDRVRRWELRGPGSHKQWINLSSRCVEDQTALSRQDAREVRSN